MTTSFLTGKLTLKQLFDVYRLYEIEHIYVYRMDRIFSKSALQIKVICLALILSAISTGEFTTNEQTQFMRMFSSGTH